MTFPTYLNSDFWQVDFNGELFSAVHVGIVGPFEGSLELVQLIGGESGTVAAVLFPQIARPLR